jgi:hypothetical protein
MYTDYAMSWMVQGSNPSRVKKYLFLFSPKSLDQLCSPPRLLCNGYQVLPGGGGVKHPGCEVNHSPPFFPGQTSPLCSIISRKYIKMKARQSAQLNLLSKLAELRQHVSAPLVSHPQACVVF